MTWPPRWTGPNFKTGITPKKERLKRAASSKKKEISEKTKAKRRDRRCRFPLCGCHRHGFALHAAHFIQHKGMGGNPTNTRSTADKLITVCAPRHREHPISLDRGAIQCEPIDAALGADGPVVWYLTGFGEKVYPGKRRFEVAREVRPGVLEPLTDTQRTILKRLALMER